MDRRIVGWWDKENVWHNFKTDPYDTIEAASVITVEETLTLEELKKRYPLIF